MNIVVLMKFVPDLVEELEIDAATHLLDRAFLRLVPNELDEHALEEALLLKERGGGTVTVVAPDTGDVDETLFTALAKGADRAVKIPGDGFDEGIGNQKLAAVVEPVLGELSADLILTGTQAVDDLDGFVGPLVAERLGLPYVGYVTKVTAENGKLVARKEYPGGLNADVEVSLPAVLGIQAAEKPPRYVVTSLVMQAMKSATIDEMEAGEVEAGTELPVSNMAIPESGTRAEMLEGDVPEVAEALARLLKDRGVIV